jgi:hypothetical protein
MLSPTRLFRALLASALLLSLAGAGLATAYDGEDAASVTVSGPTGTIRCNVWYTIRATVRDITGKAIFNHVVHWNIVLKLSSKDAISPTSSRTNGSGVATTRVKLACVAGPRSVRARADAVSASFVLPLTSAGLPRTSTTDLTGSDSTPPWVLALLALVVTSSAAFATRRRHTRGSF